MGKEKVKSRKDSALAYRDSEGVEKPPTLAGLLFEGADFIARKISDFMPLGRGIRDAFSSKEEGLISWNEVRKIALGVLNLQREKPEVIQDEVVEQYQEMLGSSKVAVERYTGLAAESLPDRVMVFDQADWIDANIDTFRFVFDEISSKYIEFIAEAGGKGEGGIPKGAHRLARTMLTIQVGTMMGYLSRNVLGQYDLSLPGPETEGKLYVVEPNVERITGELDLVPREFRHWIVLHEATHSFEFQSSKWLRDYLSSSMKEYLDEIDWTILSQPNLKERAKKVGRGNEEGSIGGSLISLVLSEKQSQILNRLQAVMCVIEGYSSHVMDKVGEQILPSYSVMKQRFERKRNIRSPIERLFRRMIGIDLKLTQYKEGERFVNHVVEARGMKFANLVWESQENMPQMEEIKNPPLWIERIAKTYGTVP